MRKIFLCLIFLIIQAPFGYTQQRKIDSLKQVLKAAKEDTNKVNLLNQLSEEQKNISNYDSSMFFASSAKLLAEKTGFKKGEATALRYIGIVYWQKGNYPAALENDNNALSINNQNGYKKGIAADYSSIGAIYESEGDYPKALDNVFKSLAISKEINDKPGLATNYSNIAIVYSDQGNTEKALECALKALDIYKEKDVNDTGNIARSLGNIGSMYLDKGNYTKAMEYDSMALCLYRKINNGGGIAINLENIALIYEDRNEYVKSIDYDLQAFDIYKKEGDKDGMAYTLIDLGSNYTKSKKYVEAQKYLDSALATARSIDSKADIEYAYQYLSTLDSIKGNYKTSFENYKEYIAYRDSLLNEVNTKKSVQAEMNYEFEQKEAAQKAEQDKKDAITRSDKRKQQIITGSVGVGLLLVLVFSGLLFSRFRITQRQKKIIERQRDIVEEKNKEILDSITYAKRLQDAILPPLGVIKKYLPESFVLYKPKDIVAGDFYWMERSDDMIFIAACDCTGHGVPGAMVSVVCSNALNRTVKEFHITETGKLLDKVRELVIETFEKSESEVKDGMDISLCSIDKNTRKIYWSGAYNPLWYMQNNELKELTADKQPIGKQENQKPFKTHLIDLQNGDILYLFTDGYADQFGGPKGKKFKYKQLQEKLLAISSFNMDKQKEILDETIETWKSGMEQTDDVCIIGIRV
jgi:serine phosphatase RsbU (regulator of sigma subunit)